MMIDVGEAGSDLSKLLDRVANGEELVLGRAGRPLARLAPYGGARPSRSPRRPGRLAGTVRIAADFDETPARLIADFEGAGEESK